MEYKRTKGKITKIVVEQELCIGCGACVATIPEVFVLNKKGRSEVKNPDAGDDNSIKNAADVCPVSAISIFEGEKKILPKK